MKVNKMGIIFVVAVLGLAGIGASYAGFTDTITITGTVNTGTVDLQVVKFSGTWVYKEVINKDMEEEHLLHIWHDWIDETKLLTAKIGNTEYTDIPSWTNEPDWWDEAATYQLIAWSIAKTDSTDESGDKIIMEWQNIFPIQDDMGYNPDCFMVDVLFHYTGKVPARLMGFEPENFYGIKLNGDPANYQWLIDLATYSNYVWAKAYEVPYTGEFVLPDTPWEITPGDQIDPGHQFHYCDYFKLDIFFDLPQDRETWPDGYQPFTGQLDSYQGLSASGTCTFSLIQFDEY